MNDKKEIVNSGLCFTDLLTLVFIVLKLLNIIKWSWLWVLAPIWIQLVLVILIILIMVIINIVKNNKKE